MYDIHTMYDILNHKILFDYCLKQNNVFFMHNWEA